MQARVKQLGATCEPPVYIEVLPASPVDCLRQYPEIAAELFNEQELPSECPLNMLLFEHVRSKIACRRGLREGWHSGASNSSQALTMTTLMPILQGSRMHVATGC
jgi:hypothetical protein